MDVREKKKDLRKKYINIRKNIDNKQEKSIEIINKLIQEEKYIKSKTIGLYNSLPDEVDTEKLIKYSFLLDKIVLLPRIIDKELMFYQVKEFEELIKNSFGIYEPVMDHNKLLKKEEIDLIIVPGVCFDKERNRLGFGKGYYDRYLENSNVETIAICFEEQILDDDILPTEVTDKKVRKIITNKNIYK